MIPKIQKQNNQKTYQMSIFKETDLSFYEIQFYEDKTSSLTAINMLWKYPELIYLSNATNEYNSYPNEYLLYLSPMSSSEVKQKFWLLKF